MNTKWMLGMGLLALSNVGLTAGWQDSQTRCSCPHSRHEPHPSLRR